MCIRDRGITVQICPADQIRDPADAQSPQAFVITLALQSKIAVEIITPVQTYPPGLSIQIVMTSLSVAIDVYKRQSRTWANSCSIPKNIYTIYASYT